MVIRVGRKRMKNLIIGIIVLVILWLIPQFINTSVIPNVIEWATKFILPWIILYWFIRLVKNLEKK
jgi:hypothetical protein